MEKEKRWRLKKCCCCMPLRTGVMCLAYFNLFLEALSVVVQFLPVTPATMAAIILDNLLVGCTPLPEAITLVFPALCLGYAVVLVYALRKNDTSLLYVYMWYGTTSIAVTMLLCFVFSVYMAPDFFKLLLLPAIGVLYQGYILILVHSVRVEIFENAADKNRNTTDEESQPIATAPPAHAANMADYAEKTSL